MATEIKLPEIGEGVTEGEMVKWLVKPGDALKMDQPLAEVMTDKATVEIPSTFTGSVVSLAVKEGDVVKVGGLLLTIEQAGSAAKPATPVATPAVPAPKPASGPAPAQMVASTAVHSSVHPPAADSRVLATPSTRRLARESGIDINGLRGTGPAGRVTREDVMSSSGTGAVAAGQPTFATTSAKPSIPKPSYQGPVGALEDREPLRGIRKKIAEKMQMAKHIIPHFTLMEEANVTQLVTMRSEIKDLAAKKGVKVTYLPFVMKALIATIREYKQFNASIDDEGQAIVYKNYYNIGFAADTPQGLVVPVIKDADRKTIIQLGAEITELSDKARAGKLTVEDMKGATISITNIGSIGGTYATPIINHPEVAILGMYKIAKRPLWTGSEFKPVDVMNVTITADHRLIDGAVAANFLKSFVGRLENPGMLMLDLM